MQEATESLWIGQGLEIGEELQLSLLKSLLEVAKEFLAEQSGKDSDGKKESLPAGYPLTGVCGQSASGNDAVQVRVKQQGLGPAMQHGKETDFGSEMFRVGSDGTQGFRSRAKKDGVENFLVLECHGADLFGNSKDNMIIGCGKQLGHARLEPLCFGKGLAFGAVAIAAAVIGITLLAAAVALVDMSAQEGGPADFDGAHGTVLLAKHGRAVDLPILRAALTEDIGHFQGRSSHGNAGGSGRPGSNSKGLGVAWMVVLETVVYIAVVFKLRCPSNA